MTLLEIHMAKHCTRKKSVYSATLGRKVVRCAKFAGGKSKSKSKSK